jgi:mannitol 2-dehydrogenase
MDELKLSLANLPVLAERISVPRYERSSLRPGIVHIGVGNFHRAHLGCYLDDLFNLGTDLDWAIVGAGVMPSDGVMREALKAQDYLTTVIEQDRTRRSARVTGPMLDFIEPADHERLVDVLADPAIRIVSLTVTEGGYMIDPATGQFDPGHPAIRKDAANPQTPGSVFGLILLGLARRRARGVAPFTVMSCDNIPHNGVVARNAVTGLARLFDAELADWVVQNVAFPSAMVDRITPATIDREITSREFGIKDNWPVVCETFRQWVIEDQFSNGRPALEKVGVTFVSDVTPFELMKIRILNGGHAILAYAGGLLGFQHVHEAMEQPLIRAFLDKVEHEEVMPTVPPVPGTNLQDYYAQIVQRFSNPNVSDTIRRLCFDGSNRQPKFIVPSIAEQLRAGRSLRGLALASALWCRYCVGTTDSGAMIEPNDPNWERLTWLAKDAIHKPELWIEMQDIYGQVGRDPLFRKTFQRALADVWIRGVANALEQYIRQG